MTEERQRDETAGARRADSAKDSREPSGRTRAIRYEQAVYGSFAFGGDGYRILAHSPGCRPEWLADFRAACQRTGEPPAGAADASGLFALRLPSGPWAIVGVGPQGLDDHGRPGARSFHALFLTPRQYARAGANPFAFAPLLRQDWSAETTSLPSGLKEIAVAGNASDATADPRAAVIANALTRRRRVAIESPSPIDDLARQVWSRLPHRVRARASVSTWDYANANRFDLVALPRLAGVVLDESYRDPATLADRPDHGADPIVRRILASPATPRLLALVGIVIVLGATVVGLALSAKEERRPLPGSRPGASGAVPSPASAPSKPPADRPGAIEPAEARQLANALAELADRLGVPADGDPTGVMTRIASGPRYQGPWLSEAERSRLSADPGSEARLALDWDAHVRKFENDRPLPDEFRTRSLPGQAAALAWSFHEDGLTLPVEPGGPARGTGELIQALSEALAVAVPVRPLTLESEYPVLASYRSFLSRLPRR